MCHIILFGYSLYVLWLSLMEKMKCSIEINIFLLLFSFVTLLELLWPHVLFTYIFLLLHVHVIYQAEKVFNQDLYFKKTVKYVGEPMTHLESIASSAVYFDLCNYNFCSCL